METITIKKSLAIAVALTIAYLLFSNLYMYNKNKQLHKKYMDTYRQIHHCNKEKNEQEEGPKDKAL